MALKIAYISAVEIGGDSPGSWRRGLCSNSPYISALATANNPISKNIDKIIANFLFQVIGDFVKHKLYIKLMITIINNEKKQEYLAKGESGRSHK
jgi:hypothetical protein